MAKSFKEVLAQPTFKAKVPIVVPGGGQHEVELTFIYRDRQGLDDLIEEDKKLSGPLNDNKDQKLADSIAYEYESLILIANGWEFAEPFNKENISEFLMHNRNFNIAAWGAYFNEYSAAKRGN